jgi:outer membrane autotransporter barrel domain
MMIKRSPLRRTIARVQLPLIPCACALLVPAVQLPQQALAQSTCGAVAPFPATVICADTSQNTYDGILLNTSTGLSLHVSSGLVIKRSEGWNHDGVGLDGTGNDPLSVYLEDGVSITTRGEAADGVQVHSSVGNSDVLINSGADIDVTVPAPSDTASGLLGWISDPTSSGEISIRQRAGSTINVAGDIIAGIWSQQAGLGRTTIASDGVINVSGSYATGIFTGVYQLTNAERAVATLGSSGVITVDGPDAIGIWTMYEGTLASDINVDGSIEAFGPRNFGVLNSLVHAGAKSGTVSISGTGSILTHNSQSNGAMLTNEGSGSSTISNDGSVRVLGDGSIGLAVVAEGGTAEIISNGTVAAPGESGIGIMSISEADTSTVKIGASGSVVGGWQPDKALGLTPAAGVAIGSVTGSAILNQGSISAGSDRAIADTSLWIAPAGGGALAVTNSGTITGFVDFGFVAGNLFENEATGLFDLRHFADTDGDGVRDTKRVAITDFGDATSQFNNAGTVRLASVIGATNVDAANYYVPTTGAAAIPLSASDYSLNREGIVQGQMVNLGAFAHAGVIDLRGPAIGNTLLMTSSATPAAAPGAANFSANGGELRLGTYFSTGVAPGGGAGSLSDVLIVDGTILGTGATQVSILNRAGPGGMSGDNGILVVEVRDPALSAADVFALKGDFVDAGQQVVIGGTHTYALYQGGIGAEAADGNWYLRSVGLSPNNPIYEDTPEIVRPSVRPTTLMERVGNRVWHPVPGGQLDAAGDASLLEREGYWARLLGMQGHYVPELSTFGAGFERGQYGIQAGIDRELSTPMDGRLIGGLSAQYLGFSGTSGSGTLSAHGIGLGATLSYYDFSGFYLDAQANVLAYGGDYSSSVVGPMARGVGGPGFGTSLEAGYRYMLNDDWSVTPQAQLSYSNIGLNPFVDNFGARVAIDEARSLELRLGLGSEYQDSWTAGDGTTSRIKLHAGADYYHEFLGRNAVNLSSNVLESRLPSDWVGMSAGATYNWKGDTHSLYGEIGARTSVRNFGQSHEIRGNVGLRVKW